jgi:hypothetical protein
MAGTTIRVDVRTHATLRDLSKQEHTSIGQVVTDLVEKHPSGSISRSLSIA